MYFIVNIVSSSTILNRSRENKDLANLYNLFLDQLELAWIEEFVSCAENISQVNKQSNV